MAGMRVFPVLAGLALAAAAVTPAVADPPSLRDLVAAGEHWRIETPRGPIHVWAPDGYDPKTAATVVYIHGYYTHVDDAWTGHHLPAQFALSGINALFVAPEAPADWREPVAWHSLRKLLDVVKHHIDERLPAGKLVVVGHSGAHRTLTQWLGNPDLDTLVLVDAAYGDTDLYAAWVRASPEHRLIDVGDDTRHWTERLHRALPSTVTLDGFPSAETGKLPKNARILYIRSSMGHMELVTDGVALPMLLRALKAPVVSDAPLALPLGKLPGVPDEHGDDDDDASS